MLFRFFVILWTKVLAGSLQLICASELRVNLLSLPQPTHHTTTTMDFASILSSEISKSKRKSPSTTADAPPKKYLKRSEIEAQRLAAYAAEQKALEDARAAKAEAKAEAAADELARVEAIKERQRQLAEER